MHKGLSGDRHLAGRLLTDRPYFGRSARSHLTPCVSFVHQADKASLSRPLIFLPADIRAAAAMMESMLDYRVRGALWCDRVCLVMAGHR